MGGRPAEELLRLPVRLHGIQLGRPVDLIVDLDAERALGLDVLCGDEVHRFLPLAAARVADDEITVTSALTLLEEAELAFYRTRASSLSTLRGAELERGGDPVGRLRDVVVGSGGELDAVLVEDGGGVQRVDPVEGLRLQLVSAA
ncbi:MAG TPA: hypothetical protein VFI37_10720 [Gaiellaceae bacterium]|jgi:hypothetical protein|nr:hypothetical protein [Gaiellaceae bacterium]